MKILVLDNYDSFTYNLVYLLEILSKEVPLIYEVYRNDKISLEQVGSYDKVLLSPGPGLPRQAGIMPKLIKEYAPSKNILGVCLGHQAMAEAFGGTLYNLPEVYHGVATTQEVLVSEETLFKNLPHRFKVGRYHSWAVEKRSLPPEHWQITAQDEQGEIMALTHKKYDLRGVQFHPESILTEYGKEIIQNWLLA